MDRPYSDNVRRTAHLLGHCHLRRKVPDSDAQVSIDCGARVVASLLRHRRPPRRQHLRLKPDAVSVQKKHVQVRIRNRDLISFSYSYTNENENEDANAEFARTRFRFFFGTATRTETAQEPVSDRNENANENANGLRTANSFLLKPETRTDYNSDYADSRISTTNVDWIDSRLIRSQHNNSIQRLGVNLV